MKKFRSILIIFALFMAYVSSAEASTESCTALVSKSISILNLRAAGTPDGPEIRVSANAGLSVKLIANDGAEIDITTVQVRYRIFDITKRVADRVGNISPDMRVPSEMFPVGMHKLSIRVSDNNGRSTKLKLTLDVSPAQPTPT